MATNKIQYYTSQHLKWIKKQQKLIKVVLRQECILVFGFRTTLMKGFDPLQMLTTVFCLNKLGTKNKNQ